LWAKPPPLDDLECKSRYVGVKATAFKRLGVQAKSHGLLGMQAKLT